MTKAYPTRFYLVHVAFSNPRFEDEPWGDLCDGPVLTGEDAYKELDNYFDPSTPMPSLDNMRVWLVTTGDDGGTRIEDVSDDLLGDLLYDREEYEE